MQTDKVTPYRVSLTESADCDRIGVFLTHASEFSDKFGGCGAVKRHGMSAVAPDHEPLRLHLGCADRTPAGWVNVDYALGARLARLPGIVRACRALGLLRLDWPAGIVIHDLRRPFPWADDSAEAVYSSHTLEHLTGDEGRRFARECHRVLRPGGVLRIVVPDLRVCVKTYLDGKVPAGEFLESLGIDPVIPGDGWLRRVLAPWVRFPHRCMYDGDSLPALLREAGFEAELVEALHSRIADIDRLEVADRTVRAVIAEGVKR